MKIDIILTKINSSLPFNTCKKDDIKPIFDFINRSLTDIRISFQFILVQFYIVENKSLQK